MNVLEATAVDKKVNIKAVVFIIMLCPDVVLEHNVSQRKPT